MDTLFGSVGTAEREKERWAEVHHEVGLTDILQRSGFFPEGGAAGYHKDKSSMEKEKPEVLEEA
jgi:hypothetical protein